MMQISKFLTPEIQLSATKLWLWSVCKQEIEAKSLFLKPLTGPHPCPPLPTAWGAAGEGREAHSRPDCGTALSTFTQARGAGGTWRGGPVLRPWVWNWAPAGLGAASHICTDDFCLEPLLCLHFISFHKMSLSFTNCNNITIIKWEKGIKNQIMIFMNSTSKENWTN